MNSFQSAIVDPAVNANGVPSISPGLARGTSAYPGCPPTNPANPERVSSATVRRAGCNSFRVGPARGWEPRVARASQPWAGRWNAVGVCIQRKGGWGSKIGVGLTTVLRAIARSVNSVTRSTLLPTPMTPIVRHLLLATLCCTALLPDSSAVEPGFIPLLDREHTDGWKQCGNGGMNISGGIATTYAPDKPAAVYWYGKKEFADFVLKLEFKHGEAPSKSGIYLRIPALENDPVAVERGSYKVQIYGKQTDDRPTGAIYGKKDPSSVPQRLGDWNDLEITVVGQEYSVRLNDQLVNTFAGSGNTRGYVGFQCHWKGAVQFRNVRIKEIGPQQQSVTANPSTPSAVPINPNQPLLETLSQQAPNASA